MEWDFITFNKIVTCIDCRMNFNSIKDKKYKITLYYADSVFLHFTCNLHVISSPLTIIYLYMYLSLFKVFLLKAIAYFRF